MIALMIVLMLVSPLNGNHDSDEASATPLSSIPGNSGSGTGTGAGAGSGRQLERGPATVRLSPLPAIPGYR